MAPARSERRGCSEIGQKPGFSRADMVFVCATAFHGTMTLVCKTKTRFLMPCLNSYVRELKSDPLPKPGSGSLFSDCASQGAAWPV